MPASREFKDRTDVETAVLEALADRGGEGMTVFELRSHVDADIDDIEAALSQLNEDELITVDNGAERAVIVPDEQVLPVDETSSDEPSIWEAIRERLGF